MEPRLKRSDVVRATLAAAGEDALCVVCNGMIGREAWTAGDHPGRFYMIGSMGLAVSVALGLALAQPRRRVLCLDGDGNVLMGLGVLASVGAARPANLYHVILDNESHASTGGQRTVSSAVPLERVALACGYASATLTAAETLTHDLEAMFANPGPACLLAKVEPGNVKGIARVGRTPRQITDDMHAFTTAGTNKGPSSAG